MKTFYIKTYGCKVNHHDSSLLRAGLVQAGFSEGADVALLNTCAVTEEAGREALRQARKIKRENPERPVVITGCGAQVDTALYEKSGSVDLIVANSHRKDLPVLLRRFFQERGSTPKVFKSGIFKTEGIYTGAFQRDSDRTRVFLKIQDGCDSFCSFCIIPFARGKSRSLPLKELVKSVKGFADSGVEEIVLTGVHIGDYSDGENRLTDLIRAILNQTALPRLRLTSLEPVELTEELLECYEDPRMCPHFHLSIQSASSPVLKAMKRKYGRREVERAFFLIQRKVPGAFVGMDVIAGFPDETENCFEETYNVLRDSPWTQVHVFPYSPRRKMSREQNKRSLVLRRAGQLRNLSAARFEGEMKKQVGTRKRVLLFQTDNQKGLSRDYWRVELPPSRRRGETPVFISSVGKSALRGEYSKTTAVRKV